MFPSIPHLLLDSAQKHADRPALIMRPRFRRVRLSYRELLQHAVGIAEALEKNGIRTGDRVVLWAENSPYWTAAYCGILWRGAVAVPLHLENTKDFIERVEHETEAKALIKSSSLSISPQHPMSLFNIDEFPSARTASLTKLVTQHPPASKSGDELAEIMYTSGTTGKPKGVMLSHKNLLSNIDAITRAIPAGPNDRFLSTLPLSHMFEQTAGMLAPLAVGASIVYLPRTNSKLIRETLREHRITMMLSVPQFLSIVMRNIESHAAERGAAELLQLMRTLAEPLPLSLRRILFHSIYRKLGGGLRMISSGGAPLDPALEKKWELFGIPILQGYGLTETAPVVTANTFAHHRFSSVGKPLKGVSVQIAQDGEILVNGPNVFGGYYRHPDKTKEVFDKDGWFKTGDIGELDKDGFLFIRGRKKYMILGPAGQNIYPEDIEQILIDEDGVRDAVVLGLARAGGVEIHAALLLTPDANGEEIVQSANKKLSGFQRIQNCTVWHEFDFPRSATRKPQKEEIRAFIKESRKRKEKQPGKPTQQEPSDLIQLVSAIFEKPASSTTVDTELVRELGMDSLLRIELVARIEEELGVALDESALTEKTRVKDIAALITAGGEAEKKERVSFSTWQYHPLLDMLRTITYPLFWLFYGLFVDLEVRGLEQVENASKPLIFMPNHRTFADAGVVSYALSKETRLRLSHAAALDVLRRRPVGTFFIKLLIGAFPFARREGDPITKSLQFLGKLLDKGWSVVIFPEGGIQQSKTPVPILPLKRGAGLVAVEMQVPIVPVYIDGIENVFPRERAVPKKRGRVRVIFGKPLTFRKKESYDGATGQIEKALRSLARTLDGDT